MLTNLLTLPRRRLVIKITGLSVLLVTLTITFFAWQNYRRERWLIQARFGKGLQRIVQVAALGMTGEDHRRLMAGDKAVRGVLQAKIDAIEGVAQLGTGDVYTLAVDAKTVLALPPEMPLRLPVGIRRNAQDPAEVRIMPSATVPAIQRAVSKGTSSYSSLYVMDNDEFISAFAALRDVDGQVVALLAADHELTTIVGARGAIQARVVLTSSAAILLAMLMSGLLAMGIGRALQRIRAGARAIKEEHYDHRIQVERSDELGMVASQFNEMAETLAERVQILKYLPAYTYDAVAKRTRDGQPASDFEAIYATILFSDIRGYTSLSEDVGAEAIVRMLNQYLRRQAEIFAQYGGVIDKFVGDAVLGVFQGPEHAQRAVNCALAIQAAVNQMNAVQTFVTPVQIGIGIATGDLLLAEIGSEARRERTLIGSVVNLAARLCTHALGDEVVIDRVTCQAVSADLVIVHSEDVMLKGFAERQNIHVIAQKVDGK